MDNALILNRDFFVISFEPCLFVTHKETGNEQIITNGYLVTYYSLELEFISEYFISQDKFNKLISTCEFHKCENMPIYSNSVNYVYNCGFYKSDKKS